MKVRKLSLRREALGGLGSDQLAQVVAGQDWPTLDNGLKGVVSCLVSTPTWCGYVCNLTDDCK